MTTSSTRRRARLRRLGVPALALAVGVGLAGCGDDDTAAAGTRPEAGATTSTAQVQRATLQLTDGWVKAADSGMTGVFGTLVNGTDADVRLVSVSSDAAERAELHETVMAPGGGGMEMREMADGLTVPAGGSVVLEPGADHLMLLGLTAPVLPGDEVTLVLIAEDGTSYEVTVSGRSFAGADESYAGQHG